MKTGEKRMERLMTQMTEVTMRGGCPLAAAAAAVMQALAWLVVVPVLERKVALGLWLSAALVV